VDRTSRTPTLTVVFYRPMTTSNHTRREPVLGGSLWLAACRSTSRPAVDGRVNVSSLSEDQLLCSSVHLPATGRTPLTRPRRNSPHPVGDFPCVCIPNSIIISHQWEHKVMSSYSESFRAGKFHPRLIACVRSL